MAVFAYGPGWLLRTCSAEDLIGLKAFAGRPQDWLDIEGVLVRRGGELNADLVLAEAVPLLGLKGAPGDVERLQAVLGPEARGSGDRSIPRADL